MSKGGGWNIGVATVILVVIALLGMFLSTRPRLEELKERRVQINSLLREVQFGDDELEEARRREEKRNSIRAGLIKDSGLTPLGAWHRDSEPGHDLADKLRELGVSLGPFEEDVFAVEESDRKLLLAHHLKMSSEKNFRDMVARS